MIRNGLALIRMFFLLAAGYACIEIVKAREAGLPIHWPHLVSLVP